MNGIVFGVGWVDSKLLKSEAKEVCSDILKSTSGRLKTVCSLTKATKKAVFGVSAWAEGFYQVVLLTQKEWAAKSLVVIKD